VSHWPPDFPFAGGAMTIGEPVIGGGANEVLFLDAAGDLAVAEQFKYDKLTGLMTRDLPGPSNGAALVSTQPTEAATPRWFQRLGGATFGGEFDPVMSFGWNLDASGLPLNPAFGTVATNYEGNFKTDLSTEFHVNHGTADGLKQVRAFSSGMKKTDGFMQVGLTADLLKFFDAQNLGGNPLVLLTAATKLFELGPAGGSTALLVNGGAWSPLQIWDGAGGHAQPCGLDAAPGAGIMEIGVNDSRFATALVPRNVAAAGAFLRVRPSAEGVCTFYFRAGGDAGDVHEVAAIRNSGQLDLSAADAGVALLKLPKTAIVPIGGLARFKVADETGAVFYLTGQAA
jgi:hypothetical protein